MDAICCARCNVVRQQLYQLPRHDSTWSPNVGSFIRNKLALEYLELLKSRNLVSEDVYSCCMISTCGHPLIYTPLGETGLSGRNISEFVREQLLLWREMRLVGTGTVANIAFTPGGLPIILPCDRITQRAPHDDSPSGVDLVDGILRVTNMEEALHGEYSHVINYERMIHFLSSSGEPNPMRCRVF